MRSELTPSNAKFRSPPSNALRHCGMVLVSFMLVSAVPQIPTRECWFLWDVRAHHRKQYYCGIIAGMSGSTVGMRRNSAGVMKLGFPPRACTDLSQVAAIHRGSASYRGPTAGRSFREWNVLPPLNYTCLLSASKALTRDISYSGGFERHRTHDQKWN